MRVRERRRRELLAAVDHAEVGFLDLPAHGHPVEHVGGHRRGVVVAGVDAQHRLVVLAREHRLVVLVGREALAREERERRQVPRVRRRRRVRELLALEVGELLVRRVRLDDDDQVVALEVLLVALHCERDRARQVHRERRRAGREAADVQPAGAHRLDLGSVVLHLVEHDLLVEALGKVRRERLEDVLVDGRILDRRVREHDRRRVLPLLRVGRDVGDQVLVRVAVHRVELAAVGARVGGERRGERPRRGRQREDAREAGEQGANGHTYLHRIGARRRALVGGFQRADPWSNRQLVSWSQTVTSGAAGRTGRPGRPSRPAAGVSSNLSPTAIPWPPP